MSVEYKGIKTLNSAIRRIKTNGAKLSALIHETGIQALLCAMQPNDKGEPCNDARAMDQLLNALPNGMRKEGFKIWVAKYSPIRWNGDGKVGVLKTTAKGYVPYNVDGANEEPFWAASKENEVRKLSPDFLLKIIQREVEKVLSADDNGNIYNKEGEVSFHLEGNVVQMKDFAGRMKRAAEEAQAQIPATAPAVPAEIKKEATLAA